MSVRSSGYVISGDAPAHDGAAILLVSEDLTSSSQIADRIRILFERAHRSRSRPETMTREAPAFMGGKTTTPEKNRCG